MKIEITIDADYGSELYLYNNSDKLKSELKNTINQFLRNKLSIDIKCECAEIDAASGKLVNYNPYPPKRYMLCGILTRDTAKAMSIMLVRNAHMKMFTPYRIEWELDNETWIWCGTLDSYIRGSRFHKIIADKDIDSRLLRSIISTSNLSPDDIEYV